MKAGVRYLLVGVAATAIIAGAQDGVSGDGVQPNLSYDGRYTFARLRYTTRPGDPCTCEVPGSAGLAGWEHDYPHSERNLMKITTDLTSLDARSDSSVVVSADDPELMKYPTLYLSEPACWNPSEYEVKRLRKYLLKGGFLIVDDFSICTGGPVRYETSMRVFQTQIRRVLPDSKLVPISLADPMLNEFFKMDTARLGEELSREASGAPEVYGIYEHNDPKRRLVVAANYNTVIHRFWVWQSQGLWSVDSRKESYKLGVNYIIYGLTH